jgi:transcriptional regulator with XRE-family HTH domain
MEELAPVPFGVLLRRYRSKPGLTQAELAERAGISPDAISTLERGARRNPHRDTVRLLADALQRSAADRAEFLAIARQAAWGQPAEREPAPKEQAPAVRIFLLAGLQPRYVHARQRELSALPNLPYLTHGPNLVPPGSFCAAARPS